MKAERPPRNPSPTPTALSGLSNYHSFHMITEQKVSPLSTLDYTVVLKTHFDELSRYLAYYLPELPPHARPTARAKLTRLTIQQFFEVSTDVYDELVRRRTPNGGPFLRVREEFHPKRNRVRQKLATLPTSRCEDLTGDVYSELVRRYPEFTEAGGVASDNSAIGDGFGDAWADLREYLEAMAEPIVYAFQNVLSGPTPSPTVTESLTEIINIVTSIVAVCNNNFPPASAKQGCIFLGELSEQANALSKVQSLPEVTTESYQLLAKSSVKVASAMKALTAL